MTQQKLKIADSISGFTERDYNSKAILNTDVNSLLKYKIQKRKNLEVNRNKTEISEMKLEIDDLRKDLIEIKSLLLKISTTIKQ